MEENDWVTVGKPEEKLRISGATIQRYFCKHIEYIKTKIEPRRGYLVTSCTVKAIEKIRHAYGGGKSKEEIDQMLEKPGLLLTIKIESEGELVTTYVAETLIHLT